MNYKITLLCLLVPLGVFSQTITYFPTNEQNVAVVQCEGFITDDKGQDIPYTDEDNAKNNIVTICPEQPSQHLIKIEFNRFDVAPGDQLRAYDGQDITAPLFTTNSTTGLGMGVSVSDAPGGSMVTASCNNTSGCVTLAFYTNGDRVKGAGFVGIVTCEPRVNTTLDCSRIESFNSGTGKFYTTAQCATGRKKVAIPIPTYINCNATGKLNVTSSCTTTLPNSVSGTGTGFIEAEFPIGQHTVTFQAEEYPDLICEAVIQVLAPNMVCNDDVNVSLSNECIVAITPNLLLENECEPATVTRPADGATVPLFTYNIQLIENDFADIIGYTIEGYPIVDFSAAACGTRLDIRIIKSYLSDTDCDGELFNGIDPDDFPTVNLCWGSITIEDKIPPTIVSGPKPSAIPCYEKSYNEEQLLAQLNELDPDLVGNGGTIELKLTDANIFVAGGDYLEVIENCYYDIDATQWEYITGDCADSETITDWNGLNYEASIFGYYRRIFIVKDRCQNEASFEQRIYIYQPDIIAPAAEIEVPCGTDVDPKAIYEAWIEWIKAGRPNDQRKNYASYLPNFDPTPIDFPNYNITNQSGDEVPLNIASSVCGYAVDWTDSDTVYTCGGSYKIFRTWTLYDWCDGQLKYTSLPPQVIKVGDQVAPEFLTDLSYQISGGSNLSCTVNVRFQQPQVQDDCSGEVAIRVQMNGEEKTFEGTILIFEGIPIDEALNIVLTAQDACGNKTTQTIEETFPDVVPPVAICNSNQAISLGQNCNVTVPAQSFDDGSLDNCGTLTYLAAKLNEDGSLPADSLYTSMITFLSSDLNANCNANVSIAFKVIDGSGNENVCVSQVQLQDKLAPTANHLTETLTCADAAISSLAAISNNINIVEQLDQLADWIQNHPEVGQFNAQDNCTAATDLILHITTADFTQLDRTCRSGTLTYRYRLIDQCGNGSLIYRGILNIKPVSDWSMTFPVDRILFCDSEDALPFTPITISDILTNNGCDSWGMEVETEKFETAENACYKLVNNYKFINWCTWNPSNTEIAVVERPDSLLSDNFKVSLRYLDEDEDGINDIDDGDENNNDTYIYDTEGPYKIKDVAEAVAFDIYDNTPLTYDGDFVLIDNTDRLNVETYTAISQFSGNTETYVSAQSYGNFVYRQIIKVIDINAPSVEVASYDSFCGGETPTANAANCTANVAINFSVSDACTPLEELQVSHQLKAFNTVASEDLFGTLEQISDGQFRIAGNYPLQNNGLAAQHTFILTVTDGCGNTALIEIPFEVKDCKAPIVVCNMGLSTTMPVDGILTFDATDFDAGTLDFCTGRDAILLTFADPMRYPDSTARTFRCERNEVGVVGVTLWAMDQAGNVSSCETFININPFAENSCSGENIASIAGLVSTEDNKRIENVAVNLSGNETDMEMTNTNGEFAFSNLLIGYDYTVKPIKDTNPLNGVSTFDLLLINKHILDIEPLNSPYKMIAADVNRSGTITTFDMILIRRVILNYDQRFQQNTSWRFVPTHYDFPDPTNPWLENFPEQMSINDFDQSEEAANFIAIKIGDVNGTSAPNDSESIESRMQESLTTLNATVEKTEAADLFRIKLSMDELDLVEGFQFSLIYANELELLTVESNELTNKNWNKEGNEVNFSWVKTKAALTEIVLVFRSNASSINWEKILQLNRSNISAEVYKSGEIETLELQVETLNELPAIAASSPNPFHLQTQIPIRLSESSKVIVNIQNVAGQVVYQKQQHCEAGVYSLGIDRRELPSAGIYFCTITIGNFSATQKIIAW